MRVFSRSNHNPNPNRLKVCSAAAGVMGARRAGPVALGAAAAAAACVSAAAAAAFWLGLGRGLRVTSTPSSLLTSHKT